MIIIFKDNFLYVLQYQILMSVLWKLNALSGINNKSLFRVHVEEILLINHSCLLLFPVHVVIIID